MTDSDDKGSGPKAGGNAPKDSDATPAVADADDSDRIEYGDQSAHLAFQQQLADLLDQADITEEQRQQFLIAASCPCCGAGGLSFSLKLKTDSTPKF